MASITYNIPDEKIDQFKQGFLKYHPVPVDEEGAPKMTEVAWIKKWGQNQFISAYKAGMRQLAAENMEIDNTIITGV